MITVDELAMFMNVGWPGEDWYLSDHAEYLWEKTFTSGSVGEIYRPCHSGTFIHLHAFEARIRWQGIGRDPTHGAGYRLSELFMSWRRQLQDVVIVAYVPRAQVERVTIQLQEAGCLLANT
jgi:hypothetical protein